MIFATTKQRILEYLDYKGVDKRTFFQSTDIKRGLLDSDKLQATVSDVSIAKILVTYPDLNPDWLLTGKGSMLREQQESNVPVVNYEHKGAPYYDIDFIGGFDDVFNDQTTHPAYCIDFAPYNKEWVMWCNLTGHSMEPELNNGDVIAIREMKTPIEYLPLGEIYAFVTDEYRTVKRLARSSREGFIKLVPSNKSHEYSEQEIPVSMVRKVFVVLGCIHKF